MSHTTNHTYTYIAYTGGWVSETTYEGERYMCPGALAMEGDAFKGDTLEGRIRVIPHVGQRVCLHGDLYLVSEVIPCDAESGSGGPDVILMITACVSHTVS